ncbi:MAG TPA: universal stress protein [Rhizomicrobium sp.]
MAFAKILAPVTGTTRDASILLTAIEAAKPFNAHVAALFVHADPREGLPYTESGMPLAPEIVQELVDDAEDMARNASKAARTTLADIVRDTGIKLVATPECADTVTASYRESFGHYASCVADAAKLSDLIVFAPILSADGSDVSQALITTITKTSRPVLLSPVEPPKSLGRHIAIGWDGSQSAAHALITATPFLKHAEEIELFSVQHAPVKKGQCAEAAEYLKLHGLACTERDIDQGNAGVGETLLAQAMASGADLLVIGGYGHSRLRETILGGATIHIISHATMPVLLVH